MASDFDPYHRWLGIPPHEQPPDHYRLLGVSRFESNLEVISNASDQRMTHLRTLATGQRSVESQRLLNEVAAATRCLLDPAKKAEYDAQLRQAIAAKAPQPTRLLPMATAISAAAYSPARALPLHEMSPQPLPSPVSEQQAFGASTASAAGGFSPRVAQRRPVRRSSNAGIGLAILGLALLALVGVGGFYAYRTSQEVAVEKPRDSVKEKPIKPKPVEPVVTPPVGPETPVKPETRPRTAWYYANFEGGSGFFQKTDSGEWKEFFKGNLKFRYTQAAQTSEYVELQTGSLRLRLFDDHLEAMLDGKEFIRRQDGSWLTDADLAAKLKSAPQLKPAPPKPVAIYRFQGESVANLNTRRKIFAAARPFTVEFWYRRQGDLATSAGLLRMGDLHLAIMRKDESDQRHYVTLFAANSDTSFTANNELLVDQEWHHLAVTGDGSKVAVHHDGQPIVATALMDLGVNSLEPIALGSAQSGNGQEVFYGEIKSVGVTDQAKYPAGQSFMPPEPEANRLLRGTSLALAKIKEPTTDPMPMPAPQLSDLLKPKSDSLPKVDRVEPPEGDALTAAEAAVTSVYGERVRAAQKRDDKQKLAAELLKTATTDRDAARSYALLMKARGLAVAAMDVALGTEIVNELDRRFNVERVVLLDKLLTDLEKRSLTPQQREVLLDEALAGAQAAMKQDQVAAADSLSVLAMRSAAKGKDAEKKKFAASLRERAVALKSAFEAMQSGLEKLKESPDDPDANLAVGRYLAFARGDFAKGCELLVKGSDAALGAAARQHLAAKSEDDRLAALESWNSLLASLKSPAEKLQLQRHILDACEELRPRLTGLALAQAEKHISELRPVVAEADKYTGGLAASRPVPGLIVRIITGRVNAKLPTPFVAIAKNSQDLANLNSVELLRPYRERARLRYLLTGAVVVENDMEVLLRFENCNVSLLNEARVAGNGRSIDQRIMLKKGIYPIAIESTGPGFTFDVNSADSVESLLFHHPRDLEAELARPGLDPSGAGQIKSQLIN